MSGFDMTDTICAPATVLGTGAISIVRVSGAEALKTADRVVKFRKGAAVSSDGYTLKYGTIYDGDKVLDDVIVSIYRAPHSYTGEDSVEISCHASAYIGSRLLELLCDAGCRLAEPGEFTRRAFAGGKMDLAQAEAVADVIAARSGASLRVAMDQLRGGYSRKLRELREELLRITSLMELELDFSEEDVEFADRRQLQSLVADALGHIGALADSFRDGNAIKNGIPVAIVGAANAGKSTLLNTLLGEERAIVSEIAGTTRDTIEETMVLDGLTYRFIDTAGIRGTDDKIEQIGISRAYESLSAADVVLVLIDATMGLEEARNSLAEIMPHVEEQRQAFIVLRSKVDVFDAINPEEFPRKDTAYGVLDIKYPAFGTFDKTPDALAEALGVREVMDISAKTGEGMDGLRRWLAASQRDRFGAGSETLVTNVRHYNALHRAGESLDAVGKGLAAGLPTDLIAQNLREALHHLGTITGDISTDEVLGQIFSKFCIGK